jgi:hypothetical protein
MWPISTAHARSRATAFALAAAVACAGVSGCHWLRWRAIARMHADLIERLALDGADALAAPGKGLEPSDIERLRYPLERARAFAGSAHRRLDGAAWLTAFDQLIAADGELVAHLDRARVRHVGAREAARAHALARRVAVAAAAVRAALDANR